MSQAVSDLSPMSQQAGTDSQITPLDSVESDTSKVASKSLSLSTPRLLTLLGTVLFIASHFFLWWELKLVAPQFPKGLFIQATSYEIQDSPKTAFNDIREVDGLNHYIGMMSLGEAAKIEMSIAIPAIVMFSILGLVAVILKKKWAALLTIPIILFPFVYIADLAYWLWYAGHNLDPTAAITLESFTPRVLGTGYIAQFSTVAVLQPGWYIATAAALACLVGLILGMRRKSSA